MLLIENGEVLDPRPIGRHSILMAGTQILKVGQVDRAALETLDVPCEVINATDRIVVPGLIDPHEHLLGGSGEGGFRFQTPEIRLSEILLGGITTVVGVLGVDTTMKNMAALIGRAKALREEGLSAYAWTGGYDVPPSTITGSVRNDILFIDEVIGAGEIAISDERSLDPSAHELAKLVSDTFIGGHLSGKAGVTHFHTGPRERKLQLLRRLIDDFDVKPEWLYPTHVERSEALMQEAISLARAGATVDVDVVEHDLPRWFRYYHDNGGPPDRLTVSTDAADSSPRSLLEQIRACVREGFRIEQVLPAATANTARVLKLRSKGRIAEECDADLLLLEPGSLELTDVIANGRVLVRSASLLETEQALRTDRDRASASILRRPRL